MSEFKEQCPHICGGTVVEVEELKDHAEGLLAPPKVVTHSGCCQVCPECHQRIKNRQFMSHLRGRDCHRLSKLDAEEIVTQLTKYQTP